MLSAAADVSSKSRKCFRQSRPSDAVSCSWTRAAGMGGAASCSRGERLAVGAGQPLGHGGLPGGERLPIFMAPHFRCPSAANCCSAVRCCTCCATSSAGRLSMLPRGPTAVRQTLAAEARRAGPSGSDPRPSPRRRRPQLRRWGPVRRVRPVRGTALRRLRHSGVQLGQDASQRAQTASDCLAGACEEPCGLLRRAFPTAFEEPTMHADIQLISDGDGLAVIGNATAVDRFLAAEGLPSRDLGLKRLHSVLKTGSGIAQAGSEIATQSGRWVKLTKESAEKKSKHPLMKGSRPDVNRAVLTENGKITGLLELVKSPGSGLTNPALLSGAAGLMAQLAMQQTMDEITDYLATIDAKLDDVLRAQEDAVLADMIGVGFDIDEAMTLREHGGRVNEVTWSKVQGSSATIARTQAYALRQLDALAEKLERQTSVGDLAETAKKAEAKTQDWLAVLARCFQLQDAIAVLELDRVLEVAPEDLDGHRLGLKAVRQKRLETITQATEGLLARLDAAAGTANAKVLLNPLQSPAIVRAREHVAN